jgi:hypothetical protein
MYLPLFRFQQNRPALGAVKGKRIGARFEHRGAASVLPAELTALSDTKQRNL